MSRPLRCALVIPAPLGSVRRALWRADVWTRTFRALGYRCSDEVGPTPLVSGQRLRFRSDKKWGMPSAADIHVLGDSAELPELSLRIGRSTSAGVGLKMAETGAGTLTTVDFRSERAGTLTRSRLLGVGQMVLGIATVTARDPQVVVAGAVIDGDRVLVARRVRPPQLAGKWEMPGGKVDPGEGEREALMRELFEELGIRVRVGDPIGADIDLGDGLLLRSFEASLVSGTPRPMETDRAHDEVRWLTADDLDGVEWLPGDQPFVEAVRERLTVDDPPSG